MIDATFDIDALPTDWESLVSTGIELAGNMDTGRWALGDLAGCVEKRYGQDALGTFASEIGIARKSTLKDYRRVSARFELDARASFPSLNWSHFREALRAGDQAEHWLAQAADNGWPVAELTRQIAAAIGKRVPPKLLWEGQGVLDLERIGADDYTGDPGHTEYVVILDTDDMQAEMGQRVLVKVYQLTDAGQMVEGE